MTRVGVGFGKAPEGVVLGRGARRESVVLGEDVPHPVRLLLTGADFRECPRVVVLLRVEKAMQMIAVVHHSRPRTSSWLRSPCARRGVGAKSGQAPGEL